MQHSRIFTLVALLLCPIGSLSADTGNSASSNVTVDTRSCTLTTSTFSHGSITGIETNGKYLLGDTATLTAVPSTGYVFTTWTGAATGTTQPLELIMDTDKTIGATFTQDLADTDGDGLTNFDESVILGTDPNVFDSPLITLAPVAGNASFSLSFLARNASSGMTRKYDVQSSPDLSPDSWIAMPGYSNIAGSGQTVTLTLPVVPAQKFYRLCVRLE